MSDPSLFRLRVTYVKSGRLAYLSHLELAHALERAIRRSGLPFAISQGFSPHMKIGYGAALPVGVGSTCEIYDLFLNSYVAPQKALAALANVSPEKLKPYKAEYIEHTAKAASVAFEHFVYEALLSSPVTDAVIPDKIHMRKKDKVKDVTVSDYLENSACEGNKIRFTLRAENGSSIRPDVLLQEILGATYAQCEQAMPRVESICRVEQR